MPYPRGVPQTSPRKTTRRHVGVGLAIAFTCAGAWLGCSAGTGEPSGERASADASSTPDAGGPIETDGASGDAARDSAPVLGDGSTTPSSPECVTYCNTLQGACNGDYPQFGTMKACLTGCALYPPGKPDDQSGSGNTLKCRQQHATSSLTGTYHCFHAGPFGYAGCGAMCEGFCQIAMGWCAASAGGAPFASAAACTAECESFPWAPSGPDSLAAFRETGPTSGNTLECREFQLVKALESNADRDVYCPRAATNSTACK